MTDSLSHPIGRRLETEPSATSAGGDALTSSADAFLHEVARVPKVAPLPVNSDFAGERLGRFRILSKLGEGGMGVVYLAHDPTLRRRVALKIVRKVDQSEGQRRLLREARSAAAITHPNIATIYEVGEEGGCVFIAMELVSGETLRARLAAERQGGGLPIAEATGIAREIARALAKAHKAGVVHRDLKPENVMINEDKQVKILDFGIAKFCDSTADAKRQSKAPDGGGSAPDPALDAYAITCSAGATTEDGRLVGTPCYMSPEQASGKPVDARTDVFSFGVLFYEMVTGRRPFGGGTIAEVITAITRGDPEPPSRVNPGVTSAIEAVILRCLKKDPLARYSGGNELLQVLEGNVEDPRAEPPPVKEDQKRGRLRNASLGLAALLLTGVAAALFGEDLSSKLGITKRPDRSTQSAEAMEAYREGLSANRAGRDGAPALERALKLDPSLAAAHVELAKMVYFESIEEARAHVRKAQELRSSLSERDRALLEALEALVLRKPPDYAEAVRRFSAASARFADDAELRLQLGLTTILVEGFEAGAPHIEQAIAIDPELANARAFKAGVKAYAGRFDEALRVADECLKVVPGAVECLYRKFMILEHEGACTRLEDAARQEIAARGGSRAHWALASAFASAGRPVEMVHEELRESWETAPEHVRPMLMLSDELRLDALGGNFDAAARRARAMNGALAEGPMAAHYGRFLSTFILFLEEFGRREEAAAIAEAFLARSGAEERYFPPEDSRIADDATPIALAVLLRDGRISRPDFEARLAAWARAWESKVHADFRGYIWLHGYAATVETPEDARAALAALPAYEPLPAYYPGTIVEAAAGLTFLLGGRVDEATALLSRPTKSCRALAFPLEHTRAHEWLGRALEAKGDKKGACSAYMVVLDRWGNAKPRSVTTEKAKIRADELGCDSQVKQKAGRSH